MQKILIVEDDIDIQDILKNHLIDAGYEVAVASDGVAGIAMFGDTIDLVLLDIMLPKIDGYGVCEVIRRRSQVPIIMLTALSDEENQLRGFEQQIDDYIPKPFSPKILLCKIAAILRRRTVENQNQSLLTYKELSMEVDGFHVYQGGNEVVLTSKEFALLRLMLENQGKVFTRQMLLDRLWADDLEVEDRIVDSHISALASDTPKVSTSETGNTSSADILYQDTDGGQISVDGKNWVAEADYEKNNTVPDVQWWTADEYEAWMNEQKKEMESLIGTGDGWYDGEGVFHEFTQESVAAMMDSYKGTLESIKKGVLYSKDNGDGDTYSMIPPTEDVVSFYSVDVTKDNGKTVHIGDYSTVEELDKAISDAVKNGQLTQEEADAVHQ